MSQGYEQFFKKAKEAAAGKPAAQPVRKPQQQLKFKKKTKKKVTFPYGALFFCVVGLAAAFQGYSHYDQLINYVNKIEISLFSTATASDAKATSAKAAPQEATKPVMAEPTGDELNHLMKLVERKKELDAREQELNRMESELSQQKDELKKKISELEKMRSSISNVLQERVKADEERIETLVQFYSNMKPPQAAKIFETLDEDLAVQILGRMKKKNAADILNLMKPDKAQAFTEKYAGYQRSPASSSSDRDEKGEDKDFDQEANTAPQP